jgi:cytochrome c-type biogenesis protein CcmH/NrfG
MARQSNNRPVARIPAANLASRKRLGVAVIGLVLAALIAGYLALRPRQANPFPRISTAGFDPDVVKQIEGALEGIQKAPNSAAAWGELAMVLYVYEFLEESCASYATAARLDPRQPRWPYLRALALLPHDAEAALAGLKRATELAGANPDAPRLRLAETLAERGQSEEAAKHFGELLRVRPDHTAAMLGLSRLRLAAGRATEARALLERCLRDPHTIRTAYSLLAVAAQSLGDTATAENAAHRARSLPLDRGWPDPFRDDLGARRIDLPGRLNRARQFLDAGDLKAAQPLLDQLLREHPDNAEGWLLLARARMESKDCPGAEKALKEHIRLAPGTVNGHFHLGVALLCLEHYADAAKSFERAVQIKPDFGEAHYNLGFALARAGRGRDALQPFRDAIRFSPEFIDAYILLADLLHQTGARDEAGRVIQRALELDPSDERAKVLRERIQGGR